MLEGRKFHVFNATDALGYADGYALLEQLKKKKNTVVDIAQAVQARAQQAQDTLNAIAHTTYDESLEQLKTHTKKLAKTPFQGLPLFIKENTALQGSPMQFGSDAVPAQLMKYDAPMTQFFKQLGFTPMGTTRMPEFGFNASTEYIRQAPVRNPWGLDYSVGGSSGGAAALVAAGVLPYCHANDGGGSIRIPAAVTGLVGLKPSRGRLPANEGSKLLLIDILYDGVLTRSVRDTALFFKQGEAVFKPKKGAVPMKEVFSPLKRSLRIGFTTETLAPARVDVHQKKATQDTLRQLESLGHHLEEITIPLEERFRDDFLLYWSHLAYLLSKAGKMAVHPQFNVKQTDALTQALKEHFWKHKWSFPSAVRHLNKTGRAFDELSSRYDVIVTPVLGHHTPLIDYLSPQQSGSTLIAKLLDYVSFTPIQNITGHPALSLPTALSHLGMPVGVQLTTAKGNDALLLQLGMQLEAAHPFPTIYGTPS